VTDVDLATHRPTPPRDEPPYFQACVLCDQRYPCPTVQEQVRAEAAEIVADRQRHSLQRMLDLSEVVPGCWVSWRGAENADFAGEPRGGVVLSIDHYADPETGESLRAFNVAKEYRRQVKFDRLTQDQVGSFSLPNPATVHSLRRAMGRVMGAHEGAVLTDERRMAEAIPLLLRSVS
jgi:hypothetical protein